MSTLYKREDSVKPVSQVIGQIFRYPLNASVLPMLLILTASMLLSLLPGLLGLLFFLLVWATLFKLSYEILSSTARGAMDGPPPVTQTSGWIMVKHLGLLIAVFAFYWLAVLLTGSLVLAVVLGLVLMFAMPAAIMMLAMTQSLTAALNPAAWLEIVRVTRASYLLTAVLLLLMTISQTRAEVLLLPLFGGSLVLTTLVSTLISAYFMAASFHLMGYLLYQYHDELGIELSDDRSLAERDGLVGRDGGSPMIDEARDLVADGQLEAACQQLRRGIERDGAEPPVHDYYRELLRRAGDDEALVKHGRHYVAILIHGVEDSQQALAVAEECLGLDRGFVPGNPDDVRTLATLAADQERHDLVLRLTSAFGKQHRDHPHIVDNFLLAARSMVAHRNQREKALALVQRMRRRYPDHPLAAQLASFESQLA